MKSGYQTVFSILSSFCVASLLTLGVVHTLVKARQAELGRFDDATASTLQFGYGVMPGSIIWIATLVILIKVQGKYWARRNAKSPNVR